MADQTEPRENIVDLLMVWTRALLLSRTPGLNPTTLEEMARREVNKFLDMTGGRKWYLPRQASYEADARSGRNEAIRQAQRRGVPVKVIIRTFKVSRPHFYRIVGKVS